MLLLSSDVKDKRTNSYFKVCTLIHSCLKASHSAAFADLCSSNYLDLIALTETWIDPNSTPSHLADSNPTVRPNSLYSKHNLFLKNSA